MAEMAENVHIQSSNSERLTPLTGPSPFSLGITCDVAQLTVNPPLDDNISGTLIHKGDLILDRVLYNETLEYDGSPEAQPLADTSYAHRTDKGHNYTFRPALVHSVR